MGERKQVQVGDKIRVVNPELASGYREGDILTVKRVLTPGVYVEEVSVGLYNREFEVITDPIEGKLIGGGPIKVGDKIKIKAAVMTEGKYDVGDVLTVKELRDDPFGGIHGVYVEENDHFVSYTMGEFEVIEEDTDVSFNVGDFVKFHEGDTPIDTTAGKLYEIIDIETDMGADYVVFRDDIDDKQIRQPGVFYDFEVVSAEDAQHSFNVGDYAVVTTDNHEHQAGDIVEITGIGSSSGIFDFGVNNQRTGSGYINAENIRKATEAEVKQAKADAKQEIEPGDVVKVTTHDPKFGWGEVKHGDIGIVRTVRSDSLFVDFPRQSFWTALPSELELIAKAEARADRG